MRGAVLIYLLIGVGIFFTFRLGSIQISPLSLHALGCAEPEPIAPGFFQAVCYVAWLAVGRQPGPGAGRRHLIWAARRPWMLAADCLHRHGHRLCREHPGPALQGQDEDGNYRGGPAYYMERRGLGMRLDRVVFSPLPAAGLLRLAFNAVQANSSAWR